jgi:hypothetical protein
MLTRKMLYYIYERVGCGAAANLRTPVIAGLA